ncbi:hypothetical protein BDF20DRAFT_934313 [Mycotypha africana]|uniref:uncharacterized protein n=1 Tax=Mycotypha africana TaxID=64632 RepID=UPI0023001B34|nr:uncharacterized protein BDF20DRAFT_934313 [Mycotypha africana]KAI8984150.1 hypothetical protein BDF20DRAFT_934313 [Mycotypha africana]
MMSMFKIHKIVAQRTGTDRYMSHHVLIPLSRLLLAVSMPTKTYFRFKFHICAFSTDFNDLKKFIRYLKSHLYLLELATAHVESRLQFRHFLISKHGKYKEKCELWRRRLVEYEINTRNITIILELPNIVPGSKILTSLGYRSILSSQRCCCKIAENMKCSNHTITPEKFIVNRDSNKLDQARHQIIAAKAVIR